MASIANIINKNKTLFGETHLNTPEYILSKIQEQDISFILNSICRIHTDTDIKNSESLIINYNYFKYFATPATYEIIMQHTINNIDTVLQSKPSFVIHLNMRGLTISQLDKHKQYLCYVSTVFKDKYPDTLGTCFVYDAPFIFSRLYDIVGFFVDKITLNKIQVVNKI